MRPAAMGSPIDPIGFHWPVNSGLFLPHETPSRGNAVPRGCSQSQFLQACQGFPYLTSARLHGQTGTDFPKGQKIVSLIRQLKYRSL